MATQVSYAVFRSPAKVKVSARTAASRDISARVVVVECGKNRADSALRPDVQKNQPHTGSCIAAAELCTYVHPLVRRLRVTPTVLRSRERAAEAR